MTTWKRWALTFGLAMAASCTAKEDAKGRDAGGDGDGGRLDAGDSDGGAVDAGDGGRDGGDASPGGSVEACVGEAEAGDTETQRLLFAGDGTTIGVVRHIDPDGIGTSGTLVWIADVFAISQGDAQACITDGANLTHRVSRHNLDDAIEAQIGDTTYTLTLPGLLLTRARGGTTSEPLQLTLTSCTRLNDDTACTIHAGP